MGTLLPYQAAIGITRLGLGASNLAVIFTVNQFLIIIVKPAIGYIADYFNNLKTMIVGLTILNCVLSYLLLALPPIEKKGIINWDGTELESMSTENDFCELCHISNDLRKIWKMHRKNFSIFEKNVSCNEEKVIRQVFINYCVDINTNSSTFNSTYTVLHEYCDSPLNISDVKFQTDVDPNLDKSFDHTIYISEMQNGSVSEFTIICLQTKHFASKMNFSFQHIIDSCHGVFTSEISVTGVSSSFASTMPLVNFCHRSKLKTKTTERNAIQINSFHTYQFWVFTLLILLSGTCSSCIFTLSDTACYESVQITGSDYGQQRAWGSVGWGLMTPFAGFLNDYTDNYVASMTLMTVISLLQIWNLIKMELLKPQFSQNILKDLKKVISSTEFLAFEVGVFMNGMGIGIVWFYLTWFIIDIGGSRLLIGLAHTVQSFLGEMPFMFLSGWLLKRFGHFNVVSLALMCQSVRFLAYSSLKNPWLILPIECLDGITFGAFYTAMTSYGKINCKPGTEASTQALLCSTYEGLGKIFNKIFSNSVN